MSFRAVAPFLLPLLALGAAVWSVLGGRLPPADFVFNNETEVQSLDPAVTSGQPEGRIIWSVYQCLAGRDPKDQSPRPGVAESWEVTDAGRTYTWRLREDARWSDGTPVTSKDFVYSFRRFLDPMTGAKYAQAIWCVVNAARYNAGASALRVGDPVEVELLDPPAGAPPHARGEVLLGKLLAFEVDPAWEGREVPAADFGKRHGFVVEVGGATRRFAQQGSTMDPQRYEPCKQVLLDFREVGIRAPDGRTLVTELVEPTPYWPELMGFYPMAPVNQRCIETHGWPEWTYPENLVSNGPYNVEFRRIRDRIRLRKSPTFWNRDQVKLEVVDALCVDSMLTAFNMYETGQLDWLTKAPPLIARELLKQTPPRDDFQPANLLGSYFLGINITRKPLDDVRVRRALALALDPQQIVDTVCAGENPAWSYVPPGLPGYTSQRFPQRDPAEARRLLAEAGFPGGEGFPKLEILYNTEESHRNIMELVRKQWQSVLQIDVSTRNEEWGAYLSSLQALRYDIARRSWIGDYNDPNTFLDMWVSGAGNNETGFAKPEYDRLIAQAAAEPDPAERMQLLAEAERMLATELPILPIYYYNSRNMVRPTVRGFFNNLQDSHPIEAMWVDRTAADGEQTKQQDAP